MAPFFNYWNVWTHRLDKIQEFWPEFKSVGSLPAPALMNGPFFLLVVGGGKERLSVSTSSPRSLYWTSLAFLFLTLLDPCVKTWLKRMTQWFTSDLLSEFFRFCAGHHHSSEHLQGHQEPPAVLPRPGAHQGTQVYWKGWCHCHKHLFFFSSHLFCVTLCQDVIPLLEPKDQEPSGASSSESRVYRVSRTACEIP